MHSEQCNLSRRDVRHSLTHKRGEEGGEPRGGTAGVWGGGKEKGGGGTGWAGLRFLIEFPDNAGINLTPVKFDYISGAVPPPPTPSPNARVSSVSFHPPLAPHPFSLALTAFVSVVASKRY